MGKSFQPQKPWHNKCLLQHFYISFVEHLFLPAIFSLLLASWSCSLSTWCSIWNSLPLISNSNSLLQVANHLGWQNERKWQKSRNGRHVISDTSIEKNWLIIQRQPRKNLTSSIFILVSRTLVVMPFTSTSIQELPIKTTKKMACFAVCGTAEPGTRLTAEQPRRVLLFGKMYSQVWCEMSLHNTAVHEMLCAACVTFEILFQRDIHVGWVGWTSDNFLGPSTRASAFCAWKATNEPVISCLNTCCCGHSVSSAMD